MSICKICLDNEPKNDISQLKSTENVDQSGEYLLLFCLGIQVIQGTGTSTKFCDRCFTKLVEFHHFKSLALKNEATLSSLGLQKYIENDIKCEILSQASNDYDEPLIDYSELQKGKPLEEIPSQEGVECSVDVTPFEFDKIQVFEVPIKPEPHSEPLSKKKKRQKSNLIKKEKLNKFVESKNSVSCDVCGKQLSTKYKLEKHIQTHKLVKQIIQREFECAHCNNLFTKKKSLEKHVIQKHPEEVSAKLSGKKFQCDLCTKSYHDQKNLRYHVNSIHGGVKPQCPICNKCFTASYLPAHIRSHQPGFLLHQCETCQRKFASNTLLRRHLSVHTGVKPFSCDICDAKFRLSYSVRLHKAQVHEKSKNHVCHICSKGYFTGSLLQRHIRMHSDPVTDVPGDRPKTEKVACPDCGKPMSSKHSLKQHRLLHKGQETQCHICGLAFATRKYVLKHMKTHTQIRKFGCKFCNSMFVRSEARRRHELEVHIREKKPPKNDTRKNRIRKKKVKMENVAAVTAESVPLVPELIFPISGPIKTEEEIVVTPDTTVITKGQTLY